MAAIADDIAYNTHDIDDGLRSGYLTFDMLEEIPFLAGLMREVGDRYPGLEASRFTHEIMRRQITAMVEDVISVAQDNLRQVRPQSAADIRGAGRVIATFSDAMSQTDQQIKKMLTTRIYRHPDVMLVRQNAASIVADLYRAFMAEPREMRKHYWIDQIAGMAEPAKARHVGDYIAGMTDTYAIAVHQRLFDHTPELR